jgi:hypothetical protein
MERSSRNGIARDGVKEPEDKACSGRRRKEDSDAVFLAWLRKKQAEARARKMDNEQKCVQDSEKNRGNPTDSTSSLAFDEWLRAKAKQRRAERRLHKAEQAELSEGSSVHQPQDCERAYRKWLRKKRQEAKRQCEEERHRVAIYSLIGRRSKKSIALAQAMSVAHGFLFCDYFGNHYH